MFVDFSQRLVTSVFFLGLFAFSSFGQQAGPAETKSDGGNAAIRQLLEEVRELRVFLQKSSTTSQLAQVVLERVRMQQQRVDGLMREQEAVQQKVKSLERDIPRSNETISLWETKVGLAENANQKADWEQAVRDLKRQGENIKRDLQEYKDRESQLASRINAEILKLDDLNARLDIIEREMQEATSDAAQPARKRP